MNLGKNRKQFFFLTIFLAMNSPLLGSTSSKPAKDCTALEKLVNQSSRATISKEKALNYWKTHDPMMKNFDSLNFLHVEQGPGGLIQVAIGDEDARYHCDLLRLQPNGTPQSWFLSQAQNLAKEQVVITFMPLSGEKLDYKRPIAFAVTSTNPTVIAAALRHIMGYSIYRIPILEFARVGSEKGEGFNVSYLVKFKSKNPFSTLPELSASDQTLIHFTGVSQRGPERLDGVVSTVISNPRIIDEHGRDGIFKLAPWSVSPVSILRKKDGDSWESIVDMAHPNMLGIPKGPAKSVLP